VNASHGNNADQRAFWSGKFGDSYVDRNKSIEEVNESYADQTGITVEEIFQKFFKDVDKGSRTWVCCKNWVLLIFMVLS